jgi:hypothetical protein
MQPNPKVDFLPWKPKQEPATITAIRRLRQLENDIEGFYLQLQVIRKLLEPGSEGGGQ